MATISQELVSWAWSLRSSSIEPNVQGIVADHALDGLGNAFAALRLRAAAQARALARLLGGPAEASLIGGGRQGASSAALANGILIHALDFDDTHPDALVHPTAVVLPAALAIGEREGATGRDVMTAATAGYEVVIRLGAAVRHAFHARGFHATSVCGVFSSALVTARLMGLTEAQAVNALGIAGSFAAGSLEFLSDGSATKQLHPGWASHGGIVAAFLASLGASGPASILEGDAGFFRLYAGSSVEATAITRGLGSTWFLSGTMIKPYPACQLSHASMDALMRIGQNIKDPSAIERITFEIPVESVPIVCEPLETKLRPRTPYEAKFSLQWCAAALLLDGALPVETFAPSNLTRPDILELASRVQYRSYEAGVAAASAPGLVEVKIGGHTERAEVTGGHPITSATIDDKLVLNVGDRTMAVELARLVRSLGNQPSLDDLATCLRRTPAGVAS